MVASANERPCYVDLFEPEQRIREGHDFNDQAQLACVRQEVQTADGPVMRLVQEVLRDMAMFERTGQLPHDAAYSELPAYKVVLYRAYWQ